MTRLERWPREGLSDAQRELFDEIAGSEKPGQRPRYPRVGQDGGLEGPFNARLRSPGIGMALQRLGGAVRYDSTLSDRTRELVILAVAAAWDCAYVRYAHEDIGRAVGLTDTEMEIVADGRAPVLEGQEAVALEVAHALLKDNDLDDDAYAAAVAGLGERALFEVLALVGLYLQTALQARVFRVSPPTG